MALDIDVFSIMEILGTVAFACSGAMLAIEKKLDLLGVIVLAVTTSVGGGMFRDILIGKLPPMLFRNPVYVLVAVIAAVVFFFMAGSRRFIRFCLGSVYYDRLMNLLDAIGLGAFTVVGVNAGINSPYNDYVFLSIFLGVITGVGGGLLRDIMANRVPSVLREHIYACASILGAVCYFYMRDIWGADAAVVLSASLVIAVRVLARRYDWNLPKCKIAEEERKTAE